MPSKKDVNDAWEEGKPIRGKNQNIWRKDPYGNVIRRGSYGTKGEYGWELDHRKPKSTGGTDSDRNIQPAHWKENREKSDKYPYKKSN
ncbi:MAG: HNH endonuclease [Methanomicrobia archaeon]|nr:HNH endonuclease [Methanomicrobia archaeon]